MDNFVAALRLKTLLECPPILILTKVLPTNETWGPLSRFPDVFVMKGNAALPHSLLAAGVKRCAKVVVVVTSNLAARGLETDAEALLIGKNIQGDLQQLFTVIEISMCPSLSLIDPKQRPDFSLPFFR